MSFVRQASMLGLLVTLAAALFALPPVALALEENVGLGWLFALRGPRPAPPAVAVVAIDRVAAQALGRSSPRAADWPRALHARLIDALIGAGAHVIAFDLSFATPAKDPADDEALAAALARAGNVVLLDFLEQYDAGGAGEHRIERRLTPIAPLAEAAAAHGPFVLPKRSLVHAYWLAQPGAGWPTLPVLAWQIYRDRHGWRNGIGQRAIDATEQARYLDYYGPPRSVRTLGFHDVLRAANDGADGATWLREVFGGRAVFVGYSAAHPGEQDRIRDDYRTVFSRADGLDISGVEIAATALANLIEDRAVRPLSNPQQLGVLLAFGLLLGALCIALRGFYAVAAAALAGAGYLALAHVCFAAHALWLPLTTPLLAQLPLAVLGGALWHYRQERRDRRWLEALVQDLLPPVVVDNLRSRIRSAAPAAEKELFGVFVLTDIQGYTSVAETLTPIEAKHMLDDYFALVFPSVERHGGSVSDIAGDAMLAFWLAAAPEAGLRRAACMAALEIADLTSRDDPLPGWPRLPTRVGVHGGPITLARVGASHHHEYRMVGDAANTVSRIEALSKHLGTQLLVAEGVLAGLDELLTRPLGNFLLAGKSAPLRIHELIGRVDDATPEQQRLCSAFAQALAAFDQRRWDEAAMRWSALLESFPNDGPSRFYLQRASQFAAETPVAWDGVVRMASK